MEIKPNLLSFSFKGKTPAKTHKTILDVQDEQLKANPLDEHRKKRMADMKTALTKLQELKENSSPKKLASQRAGILKQRLEALKAILEKLPPGNYKALAQELKQIAKQLNVISKSVGGSAAGASRPVMSLNTDETSADSNSKENVDANSEPTVSAAPDTTEADTAASDAKEAEKLAKEVERQVHSEARPEVNAKVDEQDESKLDKQRPSRSPLTSLQPNDDIDDKALREILTEAAKLVRQVLALLKEKHQDDDEETRELFKDIEGELGDLDNSLGQGNLAQALGESIGIGSLSGIGGLGGFVDVSV